MSWKPRAGTEPPPLQPPQPYGAAQPYGNQQNMYPNYQTGMPGAGQPPQQQYWAPQQPQSQPQQQYGQQLYQQQDYTANNANQVYQQYTQTYQPPNQTYQHQQGYPQQNYYPSQQPQPNYVQNKQGKDGWEDNWDWGWGESAKAQNAAQQAAPQHVTAQQQASMQQAQLPPPPAPVQAFNNANVIEESFASTDSWNWTMEDKNEHKPQEAHTQTVQAQASQPEYLPVDNAVHDSRPSDNRRFSNFSNQSSQSASDGVKTLNDKELVKEQLPNLALGKRFHLENLTPQWSIESQMSQESSDGVQTHSESTYLSENQSRNSNNSPTLNVENSFSHHSLEDSAHNTDWSRYSADEQTYSENTQREYRKSEGHDELANSLQDMSLFNAENPSTGAEPSQIQNPVSESRDIQERLPTPVSHFPPMQALPPLNMPPPVNVAPPVSMPSPVSMPAPVNLPPPVSMPPPVSLPASVNMPPPASMAVPISMPAPVSVPLPHPASSISPSQPPMSSSLLPPPTSASMGSSSANPFKNVGSISHKSIAKSPSPNQPPTGQFPSMPRDLTPANANLISPSAVNKVQNSRAPIGFGANLETTPDNSERPDQPQVSQFRSMPPPVQPVPDNLEVAPRSDRNEYLQTAHLSETDYGENFSRSGAPPPGLRRMVVGQQETEYGQGNPASDEPPPGLARMVPGQQTENDDDDYNQPSENYLDRHIDGQGTDSGSARPYRQGDGQQTPDHLSQTSNRPGRPIGLDRMVPGESSNIEYSQFQNPSYASNEQRVVTGVDHSYGVSDVREQNMDGSDYTDHPPRSGRNNPTNEVPIDFDISEEQQREVTMEGENLQDLSLISSAELTYSREQTLEGADLTLEGNANASDSVEAAATSSRRQSLTRGTSGDDSDRDRAFKASPRRDKHKSSRDRDRDRYGRDEKKRDRESERRPERRSDRRDRDRERHDRESPSERRHHRSSRSHRYETEDTDYYSDRERERRRYREGSYTSSKPPRPDDKDRRYRDERDRNKRYATIERDRRYDDERDGPTSRRKGERDRDKDRHDRRYRDIDPSRKHGNLRRERDEEERRRVVQFSGDTKSISKDPSEGDPYESPSRAESRSAAPTDEELTDERRRDRRRRHRHAHDYYDAGYPLPAGGAGGAALAPYLLQRQQYEYYARLREADPAAYLLLYNKLVQDPAAAAAHAAALQPQIYPQGYGPVYEARSLSGRSSANELAGNNTWRHRRDAELRDGASVRTDASDRELTTDVSLNLPLEESTRSERMTPFKFATSHVKASISSGAMALVGAGALAGAAAREGAAPRVLVLAAHHDTELLGPLLAGVTHKQTVSAYCRERAARPGREPGYALLWALLDLLVVQNGVVVGSDIAELLVKSAREQPPPATPARPARPSGLGNESGRGSSASGSAREDRGSPPAPPARPAALVSEESVDNEESAALEKFQEYLMYGNRQQALEWAISQRLWGHALFLALHTGRRERALACGRFYSSVPAAAPLHALYCTLRERPVPIEAAADWRLHAAILLSNSAAPPFAPEQKNTLIQIGDSLLSRGYEYSAQFCYLVGGAPFQRHRLAPWHPAPPGAAAPAPGPAPGPAPRLALLLAPARAASLAQLATDEAITATEIYEYARSLNQEFIVEELQVYKLVAGVRLVDAGRGERALRYCEALARAPRCCPPAALRHAHALADRLQYHDQSLADEEPALDDDAASPRHRAWLRDLAAAAAADQPPPAAAQESPAHPPAHPATPAHLAHPAQPYAWSADSQTVPPYPAPEAAPLDSTPAPPEYTYYPPPAPPAAVPDPLLYGGEQAASNEQYQSYGEDWYGRREEVQQYADNGGYWQNDYSYNNEEESRPQITMPGASAGRPSDLYDYDDDNKGTEHQEQDTDSQKQSNKKEEKPREERSKGGGGGGGGGEGKGGGGWLGGILTKLSLRPPNQMILPDDKNPTIVWDPERKRWRNTDGDEDAADAPPPPPPRLPLPQQPPAPAPSPGAGSPAAGAPPPQAPVSNIFKMQKGRHIKKSYVDVFNPSGAAPRPLPAPADVLPPAPPANNGNYFVPSNTQGAYSPAGTGEDQHWSQ